MVSNPGMCYSRAALAGEPTEQIYIGQEKTHKSQNPSVLPWDVVLLPKRVSVPELPGSPTAFSGSVQGLFPPPDTSSELLLFL